MPEGISRKVEKDINRSAILSKYTYLDIQDDILSNKTLEEIISYFNNENLKPQYNFFKEAIEEDPYIGKMKLIKQSSIDSDFPLTHLESIIFEGEDDKIYVVYRGTGDGKWIDNGDALTKESSFMQRIAEDFFNLFIERNYLNNYEGKKIIVTGHSKGGNLAQFVTLSSKYGDLINATYSFDGQGFSREAIESFNVKYGQEHFQNQLEKIYAINGRNDFISPIGINVIPQERTFFISTPNGLKNWHDISELLKDAHLNWAKDYDGNIIHGEPGSVWKFVSELSESMMALDSKDLDDLAITVMSLFEALLYYDGIPGGRYKYGTGDRAFMTKDDLVGFFENGFPEIIGTIINNESLREYSWAVFMDALGRIGTRNKGGWKLIGIMLALVLWMPSRVIVSENTWFMHKAIDHIERLIDGIAGDQKFVKEMFKNLKGAAGLFIQQVSVEELNLMH